MFVVRFANLSLALTRALSHELSSDCVIARPKGPVRTQASYGNITVLSLLKLLHTKLLNTALKHGAIKGKDTPP